MTERHEGTSPVDSDQRRPGDWVTVVPAVVTATATYGDFKRFETSTSISVK